MPLTTPANLAGTPSADSIEWEWDSVATAEGYEIEFGPDGGGYTVVDVGNNLTYTQTTLSPSTLYEARVRAYKAWNPSELFASSEVGVWYDPSDFSTMWKDTAGTTPVTAVDDLVARIDDKSGNGFHATQATEASRPVLKQDGNGNYYLLFDGVNDSLVSSSIDLTGTSKATTFKGVTNNNTSTGIIDSFGSNPIDTNGAFGTYVRVANNGDYCPAVKGTVHYYAYTSGATLPRTSVLYTFHDVTSATDTASVAARVNAQTVSLTYGAGGKPNGTTFSTQTLTIGIRPAGGFPFSGGIYSIIVRGASSTSDEINEAEAWVNGKTEAY